MLSNTSFAQCCKPEDQPTSIDTEFFPSFHQFFDAPEVGVTFLESSREEDYLLLENGDTETISYSFVFLPPSNRAVTDYDITFSCNDTLIYNSSSCSITNELSTIIDQQGVQAYNTTVDCAFNQFPGISECTLEARLKSSASRFLLSASSAPHPFLNHKHSDLQSTVSSQLFPNFSLSPQQSPVSFQPFLPMGADSRQQTLNLSSIHQETDVYSASITITIYGYVFYSGELSASSIVSGSENSYDLQQFDRVDIGPRTIESYVHFPVNESFEGSFNFLENAVFDFQSTDIILWLRESCTPPFNEETPSSIASFDGSGNFALTNSTNCGLGLAIKDSSSFPTLGLNFRPYKSGNLTMTITWSSFGDLVGVPYSQTLRLRILEPAPPVIQDIAKLPYYLSTPCGPGETLNMTVMNVERANSIEIDMPGANGEQIIWREVVQLDSYSSETDLSTISFQSFGGSGTEVSFNLTAKFNGSESDRNAVQVINGEETTANLKVSFTEPPELTSISPNVTEESGGETIILTGTFTGFTDSDRVLIGGYQIRILELELEGTTQISFTAPPRTSVGNLYIYPVIVERCAEKSDPLDLTYIAPPTILGITARGAKYDEDTAKYVFQNVENSNITFVVDVAGNSNGLAYNWAVTRSDGSAVVLSDVPDDTYLFTVPQSSLSPSETYQLGITITNVHNLEASSTVSFEIDQADNSFLAVRVFTPRVVLSRVEDIPTFIQAALYTNQNTTVNLTWSYNGTSYPAVIDINSTDVSETLTTGPTKLGLEFYIERKDLIVGTTNISLSASIDSPSLSDTDVQFITVGKAPLEAIINEGVNGTLVQNTSDVFTLTGERSNDPDIVIDGGEGATEDISYMWNWCAKSYFSNFLPSVDCSSLLPADNTVQSFNVTIDDLLNERLDKSDNPSPTFFSFGLEVSKDNRSSVAFLSFEFRTVFEAETAPTLTSIDIIDSGGNIVGNTDLFVQSEIIIRPVASDANVEWKYAIEDRSDQFQFATGNGSDATGAFVTNLDQVSRLPLGFQANTLTPGKEYVINIIVNSPNTTLVTTYEVRFKTAENADISCVGPLFSTGIVSETNIEIYANSTYNSQKLEYCFYLIGENSERYLAGWGCSSVPNVIFTFPRAGVYDIRCELKTMSGVTLAGKTLDMNLTLTLSDIEDKTQVEILEERLSIVAGKADSCENLRDHGCILSISIELQDLSNNIALAIEQSTDEAEITALNDLKQRTSDELERVARLVNILAKKTVFKTNSVGDAVQTSLILTLAGGNLFTDTNTLYNSISLMDGGMAFLQTSPGGPQSDRNLVPGLIALVNNTLTEAVKIDDKGSTRRRLLQEKERLTYGSLLIRLLINVALARREAETCGYLGSDSTTYPLQLSIPRLTDSGTEVSLIPCNVNIIIACDDDWLRGKTIGSSVVSSVCDDGFSSVENSRLEMVIIEIPSEDFIKTGLVSHIEIYTEYVAYVELNGLHTSKLPPNCLTLKFKRSDPIVPITSNTQLRSGLVRPYPETPDQFCTDKFSCFNFTPNTDDGLDIDVSTIEVRTINQGVVAAGNYTRAVAPTLVISGHGRGLFGTLLRVVMPVVIFVAVAAVAAWMSVVTGVGAYPEVDDIRWEYVERDMFGRGSVESGTFSPAVANSETNVGSTFMNMASTQGMEKRASTRASVTLANAP